MVEAGDETFARAVFDEHLSDRIAQRIGCVPDDVGVGVAGTKEAYLGRAVEQHGADEIAGRWRGRIRHHGVNRAAHGGVERAEDIIHCDAGVLDLDESENVGIQTHECRDDLVLLSLEFIDVAGSAIIGTAEGREVVQHVHRRHFQSASDHWRSRWSRIGIHKRDTACRLHTVGSIAVSEDAREPRHRPLRGHHRGGRLHGGR